MALSSNRGDLSLGLRARNPYNSPMMRFVFAPLLAAILALTSVTLAVAQHSNVGVMTVTLCSDMGEQTVTLDAQGKPVQSGHVCPDCVAAIAAQDVPQALALPMPPLVGQIEKPLAYAAVVLTRTETPAHARGPPLMM